MTDPETPQSTTNVCAALPALDRPEQADAWVLVLTSQHIAAHVVRDVTGYVVHVAPRDAARAREIIGVWIDENRPRETPKDAALSNTQHPVDLALAYGFALALLAVYFVLDRYEIASHARRIGSANAYAIVHGEVWRVLTALTLHKDAAHALGNTLIGGLFLASLSGRVGAGVALALALGSGAIGNFADALYYRTGHNSIGASTAVFGVVGLLCGLEAWRRQRIALPWRGAWVPLGAGGGLLAMLGSGGAEIDFGAHIFGMLAGMGLGYALAPQLGPTAPSVRVQIFAGFSSLAVLAFAWSIAGRFAD